VTLELARSNVNMRMQLCGCVRLSILRQSLKWQKRNPAEERATHPKWQVDEFHQNL
jgi:hypothetical protein